MFLDDNNYPIKHTKIQQEDGRWRIEFIPLSVGVHQIQRIMQIGNTVRVELLQKVNVLNYSAQRIVYGYKLYNMDESVQLVFDAANFRVQDIIAEIKGTLLALLIKILFLFWTSQFFSNARSQRRAGQRP